MYYWKNIVHAFCAVMLFFLFLLADATAAQREDVQQNPREERNILLTLKDRIRETWHSGSCDLYVPLYSWHNRLMYDTDKVRKYNENPWGAGFGKSMVDEDGDWHALYAIGFADSNKHFQPMAGYAFIKNKYLDAARDFAIGLGFTIGITARHEYDYIPLPLPLPLFSVQYKRVAIQAAYVPGLYNDGNVLFTWVRLHFN
jgi:palmitoyl transferase